MKWDPNDFIKEVRNCSYLNNNSFCFTAHEVMKPGTELERHIFRLENRAVDRSIEFTFFPSHAPGKPSVSNVFLVRPSTDEAFNLDHYVKQHHSVELGDDGFRYDTYSGTFEQRVRAFLEFATQLLAEYAEPTLQGREWPDVKHDWAGYK